MSLRTDRTCVLELGRNVVVILLAIEARDVFDYLLRNLGYFQIGELP